MGVTNTNAYDGPFYPNGVAIEFPFTFKAMAPDEVVLLSEEGAPLSASYTVLLSANKDGGTVVFTSAPTTEQLPSFLIASAPAFGVTVSLGSTTSFNPRTLNPGFERLAVQSIHLKQGVDASIKVPTGEAGFTLPPAAQRVGSTRVVGTDPANGDMRLLDGTYFQGVQGAPGRDASEMAWVSPAFEAAPGQTEFPLGLDISPMSVVVTIYGLEIVLGEDYYVAGTDTIVLTEPCTGGELIVVRAFLPGNTSVENYMAQFFGATGSGTTSDRAACQRLLDELANNKNGGEWVVPSPGHVYLIDGPLYWRSTSPLKIRGTAPTGLPYSLEGMAGFKYTGPAGSEMFILETEGANEGFPARGIEMENILIYRETVEAKGAGGAGIAMRGVTRGHLKNVVVWGFDTGILIDDNPLSAGSTSIRSGHIVLENVAVYKAASWRLKVKGAAEIFGEYCNFQADAVPGYEGDAYFGPGTNGGRTDAFHFRSCLFIGGTSVAANMPRFNVLIEDGIWGVFDACNFERSKEASVRITYSDPVRALSTGSGDYPPLTFRDCLWDAHQAYAIDSYGARIHISNPRIQQLDPYWFGWGGTVTAPAIRIRGGPGTSIPALGAVIDGGMISFEGACGILIDNAAKASVNAPYLIDKAAARAAAAEEEYEAKTGVKLGLYTTSCVVAFPGGSGFEAEPEDNGVLNSVLTHYRGFVYDRGISTQEIYTDGVADGSGNLLKPHGLTDATRKILPSPSAAYLSTGGGWVLMTVNYWDGANISVSGGGGAAGRPVRIFYSVKRGNLLPEL
ncbi:hypothetical protein [Sphingobium sp. CAP-1]|uniref:hypothetical protein n=1 Tax=Sphingobium sp. CAP-1 TaxID=2676077 RepID=UPI0012BB2100|nr:hypothetical protein [Sphingobium sp. CAP-1]QGP79996.1 hypothetical protein GL174_14140 [Sphingobium sp. CAP-1]